MTAREQWKQDYSRIRRALRDGEGLKRIGQGAYKSVFEVEGVEGWVVKRAYADGLGGAPRHKHTAITDEAITYRHIPQEYRARSMWHPAEGFMVQERLTPWNVANPVPDYKRRSAYDAWNQRLYDDERKLYKATGIGDLHGHNMAVRDDGSLAVIDWGYNSGRPSYKIQRERRLERKRWEKGVEAERARLRKQRLEREHAREDGYMVPTVQPAEPSGEARRSIMTNSNQIILMNFAEAEMRVVNLLERTGGLDA